MHTGLGGLHGVELVVDRGSRTGQVVYLVRFDEERESDVVTVGFEVRVVQEMGDVLLATRVVVIHAENLMVPFEQCLAEMGAEETGTAGDNYVFPNCVLHRSLPKVAAERITLCDVRLPAGSR